MKKSLIAFSMILVIAPSLAATMCSPENCPAGSKVTTFADRKNPFFACPSREISDYIGTVLGLLALQGSMGVMPNLSPETGEPEFTGETESMVSDLRKLAHVHTFDEAASQCKPGRSGLHATVLNNETGAISLWVVQDHTKKSFWAPQSAFNHLK